MAHSRLPDCRAGMVAAMTECFTDEDASAAFYAYSFMIGRMGEVVALEMAAEALRARHRDLDRHAADEAALALVERIKAARR